MTEEGCILFVDSDTNQLQSLQRNLHGQRQWRQLFAESPVQARALLQRQPVDILVCETRLEGMHGSALLREAKQFHPLTSRLLFSGQARREPAQEVVHYAHQFIAKPCSTEQLTAVLLRVMRLRSLLDNPAMRKLTNRLDTLPSPPDTYLRMIDTLRSESATLQDVGRQVARDPAMSTKLLQMVNSAFFGLRHRVASPAHAVSLLGIETVTHLALSAGIFDQLDTSLADAFDLKALWRHSLKVAGLTGAFCAELGLGREQSEEPILAGLLHDLGKLVLIAAHTEAYRGVVTLARRHSLPMHRAEKESLGIDHARLGAYLMGLWGLPYGAVEAVALHHQPDRQQREREQSLAVYAANLLIHAEGDVAANPHYATDGLERLLGSETLQRWRTITLEYLDGETP